MLHINIERNSAVALWHRVVENDIIVLREEIVYFKRYTHLRLAERQGAHNVQVRCVPRLQAVIQDILLLRIS